MASTSSNSTIQTFERENPNLSDKTFWDLGQFEIVITRIINGKKSINDFLFMVNERAAIERKYADKLQSWFSKWSSSVKNGSEMENVRAVWLSVLRESQIMADIHFSISSKLGLSVEEGLQKTMYEFKKSHYHKIPIVNELKEAKECREAFKKAQYAFSKAIETINKFAKKYWEAAKTYRELTVKLKEKDHANDSTIKPTKTESALKSKLDAMNEAKEKARLQYMESISYFNHHIRDNYIQDMKAEFSKCQAFEYERLMTLIKCLGGFTHAVDPQSHTEECLKNMYKELTSSLDAMNADKVIQVFAKRYGDLMLPNFPKFVEFDAKLDPHRYSSDQNLFRNKVQKIVSAKRVISHKLSPLRSDTLSKKVPTSTSKDKPKSSPVNRKSEEEDYAAANVKSDHSFNSVVDSFHLLLNNDSAQELLRNSNDHYTLYNVYVRAVDSFHATGKNHLSFSKGEVIYQLRGDENGWSYGRILRKEGIYPSEKVQLLKMDLFPL